MKNFMIPIAVFFNSALAFSANTYFCVGDQPKGAIVLKLDTQGPSIGRISTPFTRDFAELASPTANKRNFTHLFVDYVERNENIGRASCEDCYTFNASVYPLVKNKAVLDLTKSRLVRSNNAMTRKSEITLQFYIGDDQFMTMSCTKLNGVSL